jgi:hypothetical protein
MAAAELFADLLKRAAINRGVASLQKRIGQYYSDSDDDNTDQFASNQRQGLGSILGRTAAYGLLGPILGPLAFALGSGIMSRRNRMNLMSSGDPSNIGPQKTYGITNIENIKNMELPEDSGSAAGAGTTDYGITSGIDYSDSQSVADAIDSSTPDDFGQSEGMVDGWED